MAYQRKHFDLIVLGGGPGGYPAAITAAQLGQSVALVESKELGGTCLNRGCIPSKALIAGADILKQVEMAKEFGINVGKVSVDYSKMVKRKEGVVTHIRNGLEGLIKQNGITLFQGYGKFIAPKTLKVQGKDSAEISGEKIIIATGSEPKQIPSFPFDYKSIHDSTSILEIKKLPKSIVIVGGGIIGCEFASLFAALKVKVTLLEMLPRILPMESETVSEFMKNTFEKKGMTLHTDTKVKSMTKNKTGVTLSIEGQKAIKADSALIAVGRKLNTDAIGLDKAGVKVLENGIIAVNDKMETSVSGVYAVGDIASTVWLAHVATHQGIIAARNASGFESHMDYSSVPSVIFTDPEIGTVGMDLDQAIQAGYKAKASAFPFQALGKSHAANHTDGYAKIVIDVTTNQILGAQVIGYEAGTLIAEMGVAIANELTIGCITETIHAHPTLSEAWMEAAFLGKGTPLHLPPSRSKRS